MILISSWIEGQATRGQVSRTLLAFVDALEKGELGYKLVKDTRTEFFTQDLYVWADPTFDTVPVAGVFGYKLFARTADD